MKNLIQLSMSAFLLCLCFQVQAFVIGPVNGATAPVVAEEEASMSVEDFLAMTPESYAAETGKKMKWRQRMAMKVVQKRMRKQLKKGKLKAEDASNGGNLISLLSMIFGLGSVLFFLLGAVAAGGGSGAIGLLSLLFAISGLVMGIIGLKKEDSMAMALVGTITGGLIVLIFLLAIILVAAFIF